MNNNYLKMERMYFNTEIRVLFIVEEYYLVGII
jgi:hypothetical protein